MNYDLAHWHNEWPIWQPLPGVFLCTELHGSIKNFWIYISFSGILLVNLVAQISSLVITLWHRSISKERSATTSSWRYFEKKPFFHTQLSVRPYFTYVDINLRCCLLLELPITSSNQSLNPICCWIVCSISRLDSKQAVKLDIVIAPLQNWLNTMRGACDGLDTCEMTVWKNANNYII